MPEDFEFLNQEDVINLYEEKRLDFGRTELVVPSTFRLEELRNEVEKHNVTGLHTKIFDCRVLRQNQPGWRSGKMQVSVEVKGQFKVEVQHLLKSACSHGSNAKPMKETYSLLCCAVPCSWLWS